MISYKNLSLLLISVLFLLHGSGCISPIAPYSKLPPGIWRGVLYLSDAPVQVKDKDEITKKTDYEGELPFLFDVVYDDDTTFHIEIINAGERIKVDDITFGRETISSKDKIVINFTEFDTKIEATLEERVLEGFWIVNYRENYKIRFKAWHGIDTRFENKVAKPEVDYSGRWQSLFEVGTTDEYPAVADFVQKDNSITGTIETESGDYRYLEGVVTKRKAYLSCFDGAHAFLLEAKLLEDGSLTGQFRSGSHYTTTWSGVKSDSAKLKDGYGLSKPLSDKAISFSLPNHENKSISLSDEQYSNKVKLVEIMGTWCPNCKDETVFLKEYMSTAPADKVAVITMAFERYRDADKSKEILAKYKAKMALPWEILLGGYYDKAEATKSLNLIDTISSFPTLLMIDRNNKIRHVYTGFYGPATKQYAQFKTDFNAKMTELINE